MQDFLTRHYRVLSGLLLCLSLAFAFFLGRETATTSASPGVVLSCGEDVLTALSIPVEALAADTASEAASVVTVAAPSVAGATTEAKGAFVGSKNGTKYYAPHCGTVSRIKPENYVWFESAEDARLQGYSEGSC